MGQPTVFFNFKSRRIAHFDFSFTSSFVCKKSLIKEFWFQGNKSIAQFCIMTHDVFKELQQKDKKEEVRQSFRPVGRIARFAFYRPCRRNEHGMNYLGLSSLNSLEVLYYNMGYFLKKIASSSSCVIAKYQRTICTFEETQVSHLPFTKKTRTIRIFRFSGISQNFAPIFRGKESL